MEMPRRSQNSAWVRPLSFHWAMRLGQGSVVGLLIAMA